MIRRASLEVRSRPGADSKLERESFKTKKEVVMNKILAAVVLSGLVGLAPLMAQEKKDMPMKSEGMKGGGLMMEKMKEMQGGMGEMRKGMGGMMKGQGMMKSEDTKGMGKGMGEMSGMMGDMGQMMGSGKMTPEEMENMSKMMGDMSGMMKQMSDRMRRGMKKTQ
jgi:hypothetical protein